MKCIRADFKNENTNCFLKYMVLVTIVFSCIYFPILITGKMYMYLDIGADTYCSYFPTMVYDKELLKSFTTWDFSLGLGGTTVNYALLCYILDPFSWIIFLFNKHNLDVGIFLSLLIKNIFLCNFAYFYLKKMQLKGMPLILSAISYSFCGWMLGWGQHYNFATAFVLFTMILYFFEKWLLDKKWAGFIICLGVLLITSPYFAYMSLLFLAIYYLFRYFSIYKGQSAKHFIVHGFKTFGLCIWALGISAFVFVPVCMQILSSPRVSGSVGISLKPGDFSQYLTMACRMLSNNILGTSYYKGYWNYYEAPFFYIGILTLYMLPIALIKRKNRKNLLAAALVLFSIIFVNFSCIIFNAFSAFTFRWTFVVVPVVAVMLGRGLELYNDIVYKKKISIYCTCIFLVINVILLIAYHYYLKNNNDYSFTANITLGLTFVINCLYWLVFTFDFVTKKGLLNFLLICFTAEIIGNGYITVNMRSLISQDQKSELPLYDNTDKIIEYLNSIDSGYYRVYKKYDTVELDDPMMNDYYGEKIYSSSLTQPYFNLKSIFRLPEKGSNYFWGFNDRQALRNFCSGKYMFSKEMKSYYGYKYINQIDDIYIYINKNYLPFGIFYDSYTNTTDFSKLSDIDKQRMLYRSCFVSDTDKDIEDNIENVSDLEDNVLNEVNFSVVTSEEGFVLKLPEKNEEPMVLSFRMDEGDKISGAIYTVDVSERKNDGIQILFENRKTVSYILEEIEVDEIFISIDNVKNISKDVLKQIMESIHVYEYNTLDDEMLIKKYQEQGFVLTEFDDDFICGEIITENKGILSVPIIYDHGWKVTVNGEEKKIYETNGGFIGILLEEGENNIVFSYEVRGVRVFTLISMISVCLFIICVVKQKSSKHRPDI